MMALKTAGMALPSGGLSAPDLSNELAALIPGTPTFVIGGSISVRSINVQLKDCKGNNLAGRRKVRLFIGAANGTPMPHTGLSNPSVTQQVGGSATFIQTITSGVHYILGCEEDGEIALNLTTLASNGVAETVYCWVGIGDKLFRSAGFTVYKVNT